MRARSWRGNGRVLEAYPLASVARVNFYGWSLSGKRSLAEFFVNSLSRGSSVNGFTDVMFCPMLVNHLSEILMEMLQRDLHGLYHVVGPQAMTKYQFGVEIARRFGFRKLLVSPQSVEKSGLTAQRSHNLWLSITRYPQICSLSSRISPQGSVSSMPNINRVIHRKSVVINKQPLRDSGRLSFRTAV